MNKLEECKENMVNHYGAWMRSPLEQGFDAAIALELPVKFAEWRNEVRRYGFRQRAKLWKLIKALGATPTEKELYQYWIENIYKI